MNSSTDPAIFAGAVNYCPLGVALDYHVAGTGDINFSGVVYGYGMADLIKSGSNTLTLSGLEGNVGLGLVVNDGTVILDKSSSSSIHAVNDNITLNGGTIQLSGTGGDQIADTASIIVSAASTFDLNGNNETIAALEGSGGTITNSAASTTSTLTVGAGDATGAFGGTIADTGTGGTAGVVAITKAGSGTQTLSGANTYSGTTEVGGGTLALAGNSMITGEVQIDGGKTLQLGGPNGLGDSSGLAGTGTLDLNYMAFGIPVSFGSFTGTIENQKNPLTAQGTDSTPPVQPAAEVSPADSISGVRYFDGTVNIVSAPLVPDTVTTVWNQEMIWTNNPLLLTGSNGNGMTSAYQPELIQYNLTTIVVTDADGGTWFSPMEFSSDYVQKYGSGSTLTYSSESDEFTMEDPLGNTEVFYGFASTARPAAERGQLASYSNDGGEELDYAYYTSTIDAGRVETVTLKNDGNTIRSANYTYYAGTFLGDDKYGNAGDLRTSQIKDADGNLIDENYYRYYTPTNHTNGYVGGLQYMFSTASFARLSLEYSESDVFELSDADVQPYADVALQYDATSHAVTQVISQGLGCSVCDAGLGTYSYVYATNTAANDYNTWKYETTETLPDNSVNIVFSNFDGETLFTVHADSAADATPDSGVPQWMTFDTYDSASGRLIEEDEPSAVTGYTFSSDTLDVSVSADSGLINHTDYYDYDDSTTITTPDDSTTLDSDSQIGGIDGYVRDYTVRQGTGGTPILKEYFQYYLDTPSGAGGDSVLVAPVATDTVYSQTDGNDDNATDALATGGAQTTAYAYTYFSGTVQVESLTTTLPTVADQNNSGEDGVQNQTIDIFNAAGQEVWFQDANGAIGYFGYDAATGAMNVSIQDVNCTQAGTLEMPDTLTVPSGPHLNLTTTDVIDPLGRSVEETDPNFDATFTVYYDALTKSASTPATTTTAAAATRPKPTACRRPSSCSTTSPSRRRPRAARPPSRTANRVRCRPRRRRARSTA